MNRVTTALLLAAVAGVAGWWASHRTQPAPQPVPQTKADPIDPQMVRQLPDVDPQMVRQLPDVDPQMVRNPSTPRPAEDRSSPAKL